MVTEGRRVVILRGCEDGKEAGGGFWDCVTFCFLIWVLVIVLVLVPNYYKLGGLTPQTFLLSQA